MVSSRLPRSPGTQGGIKWESAALFAFGSIFLISLLVIAFIDRDPTRTSWYIYNCVLAMAAGGIAGLLPGSLSLNWHPGIKAGGALALAIIVFYGGRDLRSSEAKVQDLKSFLIFDPKAVAANPDTSDVYVIVNWKVVKSDVLSGEPDLKVDDPGRGKDVSINRGPGGIRIDFKTLSQGDKIFVAEHDQSRWWKTGDMTIPEAQLEMSEVPFAAISKRVNLR